MAKLSHTDMPMLHIVGIVGLPNGYGGFETLADHLLESPKLVHCGLKVYSERWLAEQQGGRYKGAELVALRWRANGWQSILFDTAGLWRASWQGGVVLVLGTSATFWLPLLRKLFPRTRYLVNMAGLEWARSKWGRVAKALLRHNEAAAARHAHVFIADNQGLVDYVRQTYGREPALIAYGGDQFLDVAPDMSIFEDFDLPQSFDFAMARAQVDNNMEMLLQSYASSELPLVFVSNWDSTNYGRDVRDRYSTYGNLHLIGPIYNIAKVKALHSRTRCYVHGHSAGGTNPVLVEAMWAGLPTLAYDVNFNKHTTRGCAFYFGTAEELSRVATSATQASLEASGRALYEIAIREYAWHMIRGAYEEIILTEETL
jgi:glycosyltransferase involved in cell wall biosynthesis